MIVTTLKTSYHFHYEVNNDEHNIP